MQIPIDRAVVLIGRSPECDVVLDVSSKISRMHCALVQVDTAYYIRDLGSLNGVTVAGERVEKDVKLTNGTEVQIGDVKFLFLENVLPAARAAKVAPAKGSPVFIDETMEVLDVEVVEPTGPLRPVPGLTPGRVPTLRTDVDDVEIIDAEVLEDVEVSDAIEIIEDVEIIEHVEVVDDGDIIDDVEIVEDVDVIEDVEVIDEPPRRPRPRPRPR